MRPDVVTDLAIAAGMWLGPYLLIGRFTWLQWKQGVRAALYFTLAGLLSFFFGHWSLLFILGHPLVGLLIHVAWCRAHGFDWLRFDPEAYQRSEKEWFDRMGRRES